MTRLFPSLRVKCRLGAVAFPIILLPYVLLVGCANSCFIAISNQSGTVIGASTSNLPLACPLPVKKSTIKVLANVATPCEACSPSNRIQGFFLTLKGIELRGKTSALDDSSEWLELFPDLEKSPRQIDLMARRSDATALSLLGESEPIPAGIYDQVRLRLVSNQSDSEAQFSTESACGKSEFNCMMMADGHVYALQVDNEAQELRVASEALPGSLLFSPLDGNEELIIQLTPVWSMVSSFPEGLRFLLVLKGSARVEQVNCEVRHR